MHKHRTLYYHPQITGLIVAACAVLHNICIARNEPQLEEDPADDDASNIDDLDPSGVTETSPARGNASATVTDHFARGRAVRDSLVARFTRLRYRPE